MRGIGKMAVGLVLAVTGAGTGCAKDAAPPPQQSTVQVVVKAQAGGIPRLVDLGAGKCIPCKAMAPILEGLKVEYAGRMDVQFIDVWKNPDAGKTHGLPPPVALASARTAKAASPSGRM